MTGFIAGARGKARSAKRKAQSERDSRQWAVGSKSLTTDYGTTDNQEAEGKGQRAEGERQQAVRS